METILYYRSLERATTKLKWIDRIYVRTIKKEVGKVTVCGIVNDRTIQIGYTIRRIDDQFVKKVGREIAYERARNEPSHIIKLKESDNAGIIFKHIANQIIIDNEASYLLHDNKIIKKHFSFDRKKARNNSFC